MIMKKTFLLILCCIAILITSCSLNDDSVKFHFVPLQIVDAEFPESFSLNETYNIKITYIVPNNCVAFEGFDVSNIDITSRNIVAIGSEREDEVCNLVAVEAEGSIDFICLYEGTYFFRMWSGEDGNGEQQYIELEVPVVP
jgi:hypothetical protein